MYSKRIAGLLCFVGASQFLIIMLICEALYPGYSVSENMISDLGVGSTAAFFNSSIIILGGTTLASLLLFVLGSYLGLGPGGMERMVVYPVILWGVGFGGYLMASER